MHDWITARAHDHGLRTRPELLARGFDDKAIRRAVVAGRLQRVRQGAFVPMSEWAGLTPEERHAVRARAVLLHGNVGAALSHTSAVLEHGTWLWGADLSRVHLTRFDDRSGRRQDDAVQHRGEYVLDDLTVRRGLMVTSGTRTALDLCRLLPLDKAMVAVSGLLHEGETTSDQLWHRYRSMPSQPSSRRTNVVLRLASNKFESVAECRAYHLCWSSGLPIPIPQYEVWHGGRLIARLDFAWPELRAWLEIDGEAKYRRLRRPGQSIEDAVLEEKRREDLVRRVTGWSCVRQGWRDLGDRNAFCGALLETFSRRTA